MQIKESFMVATHPDQVWEFFKDVQAVAQCMPGTELTEEVAPDTFEGALSMKVGPIGAKFAGSASVERDEATKKGLIKAVGVDKRGGSRVDATVTYELQPAEVGTQVDIVADVNLAGQLAQFGRTGIIQDISSKLTAEFASCLQQRLTQASASSNGDDPIATAPPPLSNEIKAGRLFFAALWARIKAFFKRSSRR